MMTGVYSFGSQLVNPLHRALTLRSNNIFPLLITDRLDRNFLVRPFVTYRQDNWKVISGAPTFSVD
jgi:hypothetical protein